MNRTEVIEEIAKIVVLSTLGRHVTLAVVLPTFTDVKEFRKELGLLFTKVPSWLMPNIRMDTIRRIDFGNSTILLSHSALSFRSRTLNRIYMASDLPAWTKRELSELGVVFQLVGNTSKMVTFDNE